MSRETAPNYRVQTESCLYCGYSMLERENRHYCKKHDFFFYPEDTEEHVCDDYGHWKIPFIITDNPPDYETDIENGEL